MNDNILQSEEESESSLAKKDTVMKGQKINQPATISLERKTTTPSPTGYRDYKPPAEVLDSYYHSTFEKTKTAANTSDKVAQRNKPFTESDITHKVRISNLSVPMLRKNLYLFALLFLIKNENLFVPIVERKFFL